jgi:Glutathione S-transferase, N-terminal domain
MMDLYYWTTPNGHKVALFLEEAGLPYTILPVNLSRGDQFKLEFLAISPTTAFRRSTAKIPAMAARRGQFSKRAPSSSISPEKPASSCPRICAAGPGARMALLAG